MRSSIRWFLIGVLLLDTAAAFVLLTGALPVPQVLASGETGDAGGEPAPTREALELLGRQLAERSEALLRREAELEELLRSAEVQRRAAEAEGASGVAAAKAEGPAPEAALGFQKLQRAYENMEPESAALALAELAALDKEAVLQLLMGWKPRTSGQILDALTQTHPALAADLSYRIWRQGGNNGAPAARDGR